MNRSKIIVTILALMTAPIQAEFNWWGTIRTAHNKTPDDYQLYTVDLTRLNKAGINDITTLTTALNLRNYPHSPPNSPLAAFLSDIQKQHINKIQLPAGKTAGIQEVGDQLVLAKGLEDITAPEQQSSLVVVALPQPKQGTPKTATIIGYDLRNGNKVVCYNYALASLYQHGPIAAAYKKAGATPPNSDIQLSTKIFTAQSANLRTIPWVIESIVFEHVNYPTNKPLDTLALLTNISAVSADKHLILTFNNGNPLPNFARYILTNPIKPFSYEGMFNYKPNMFINPATYANQLGIQATIPLVSNNTLFPETSISSPYLNYDPSTKTTNNRVSLCYLLPYQQVQGTAAITAQDFCKTPKIYNHSTAQKQGMSWWTNSPGCVQFYTPGTTIDLAKITLTPNSSAKAAISLTRDSAASNNLVQAIAWEQEQCKETTVYVGKKDCSPPSTTVEIEIESASQLRNKSPWWNTIKAISNTTPIPYSIYLVDTTNITDQSQEPLIQNIGQLATKATKSSLFLKNYIGDTDTTLPAFSLPGMSTPTTATNTPNNPIRTSHNPIGYIDPNTEIPNSNFSTEQLANISLNKPSELLFILPKEGGLSSILVIGIDPSQKTLRCINFIYAQYTTGNSDSIYQEHQISLANPTEDALLPWAIDKLTLASINKKAPNFFVGTATLSTPTKKLVFTFQDAQNPIPDYTKILCTPASTAGIPYWAFDAQSACTDKSDQLMVQATVNLSSTNPLYPATTLQPTSLNYDPTIDPATKRESRLSSTTICYLPSDVSFQQATITLKDHCSDGYAANNPACVAFMSATAQNTTVRPSKGNVIKAVNTPYTFNLANLGPSVKNPMRLKELLGYSHHKKCSHYVPSACYSYTTYQPDYPRLKYLFTVSYRILTALNKACLTTNIPGLGQPCKKKFSLWSNETPTRLVGNTKVNIKAPVTVEIQEINLK